MADNSNDRKKALYISMLVFLLGGGGIFLFFIIQGSNDLTGAKGKGNFTYGEAAREGVTSFFKDIGVMPDEETAFAKRKEITMKERGFLDEDKTADADISDWMDKSAAASASPQAGRTGTPTSVPRMAGRSGSAVGGGGGGSQSSGSASRFGEGASSGNTSISAKSQGSQDGAGGKGTLASLKNARAILGEGLRSNSAMTASTKWGQSFGVGSSPKSGNLAYTKSGLVGLDKIKSGEIASLKTTDAKSLKAPEPGAFKRDEDAENKDPVLQKNKEDLADQMKQAAVKAAADAALKGAESTPKNQTAASGSDPKIAAPPKEVLEEAKAGACFEAGKCPTVGVDKTGVVTKEGDGWKYTYTGVRPNGTPYTETFVKSSDGKITFTGP